MLARFCLYGFLKNQRYFEPFFMLALLAHELSFFAIGLLYACRSLTLNVLEIPSGAMADWWGRRGCMIFSFVAYVLSFLIFALANHWLWLFPAMVLFGIGDSFRTGTHKAMIFEWLRLHGREQERTRIYGITRSWSKFGSALSAVLAAVFVLVSGDYRSVFLFATIPYLLNIVNFLGYPRAVDGDSHDGCFAVREVFRQTLATLKSTWQSRSLRRLTCESMAWEGVLNAIKDYLQPALTALVLAWAITRPAPAADEAATIAATGLDPPTVILIGLTYTVLSLLSGWASRHAHTFVHNHGTESQAAARLWQYSLVLYVALGLFDVAGLFGLVSITFVALLVLQNVWRPILISRYDQHADPGRGATVLSIESQSQRLATLVIAPLVGLAIDGVSRASGTDHFWPIGMVGAAAAVLLLATAPAGSSGPASPDR